MKISVNRPPLPRSGWFRPNVAPARATVALDRVQIGATEFAPAASDLPPVVAEDQTQQMVKKLFGSNLRVEQLKDSVNNCLPGALPIVKLSIFQAGEPGLNMLVDWRDKKGQEVARSSICWVQQENGALNLQWRDLWLHPEQRQTGFFERLAEKQIQLLLDHSKHPESVLELTAGGSQGLGQSQKEIVGKYLWAKLGLFEFGSPLVQQRMSDSFGAWLNEKAAQHPQLTPALVEGLCKSSQNWTRPEEYAELDVPFFRLTSQRHGRGQPVALGKAFLLDPETSGWFGRCKINQINPEILSRAQRALAFGGRGLRDQEQPPPDAQAIQAGLLSLCTDPERPLPERQQHAQSLVALQGKFELERFAELFADAVPAEDFRKARPKLDPATPCEQQAGLALQTALWHAYQRIIQECQQQTGRTYTPEQIQQCEYHAFQDPPAFRQSLLNLDPAQAIEPGPSETRLTVERQ
ncbi:hypothetical protein JST97_21075 [bacterium]|nr:hypothetical protein [bacterium]